MLAPCGRSPIRHARPDPLRIGSPGTYADRAQDILRLTHDDWRAHSRVPSLARAYSVHQLCRQGR
jgi:hypothetical protein